MEINGAAYMVKIYRMALLPSGIRLQKHQYSLMLNGLMQNAA